MILNAQPEASQQNGSNPTRRCVDMTIVGGHNTGPCQPPLYPGLLGDYTQDQRTAISVGGWGRIKPLPLNNAQESTILGKKYFMHFKTQEQKKWRPKV